MKANNKFGQFINNSNDNDKRDGGERKRKIHM